MPECLLHNYETSKIHNILRGGGGGWAWTSECDASLQTKDLSLFQTL